MSDDKNQEGNLQNHVDVAPATDTTLPTEGGDADSSDDLAPSHPTPQPESASETIDQPEITEKAEVESVKISEHTQSAFGSDHFAEFMGLNVLGFCKIIDIADASERRDAIVSLKLGRDGVERRIELCEHYLAVQKEYATAAGIEEMLSEGVEYSKKLEKLKKWLCA